MTPLSRQSSGQSSQYSDSSSDLSRQWSSQSSQHSSQSEYDPSESGLYERLRSKLIECDRTGETQNFSRFSFLPLDALEKIVTTDTVETHSGSRGWRSWPRANGCPSDIVDQAKGVFATLGFIESPDLILNLFEEGLGDRDLPLARPEAASQSKSLLSPKGVKFKSFSKLKSKDIDDFLRCQWYVIAPVFAALGGGVEVNRDICVYKDTPLPFFNVRKISSVPGRSTVYKGMLHAAHMVSIPPNIDWCLCSSRANVCYKKPRPDGDIEVAIKDYTDQEDFDKEKNNLTKIQGLKNPHLIEHISTIQQGHSFYVIFPWANGGNLSDFWRSQTSSPQLLTWSLQQMLGIVDGLFHLHAIIFRHGDLKPENILHFKNTNTSEDRKDELGTLVIADVGVSKIHHLVTELRNGGTNEKATTPCYEAPEADINSQKPRGRSYDMWSLGCLFLEFTIWLVYGYKAIEDFKALRVDSNDPFPQKSAFYKRTGPDTAIVHPAVTTKLGELQNDPQGGVLTSLVKIIADDLIVIDPKGRVEIGPLRNKLRRIFNQAPGKDPG